MATDSNEQLDSIVSQLATLEYKQLIYVRKEFDKIISSAEEKVRDLAREKANKIAREFGLNSVDDLNGGPKEEKTRKKTYKYVLGSDFWYGRGRTPMWVKEFLNIEDNYDRSNPEQYNKMQSIKVTLKDDEEDAEEEE